MRKQYKYEFHAAAKHKMNRPVCQSVRLEILMNNSIKTPTITKISIILFMGCYTVISGTISTSSNPQRYRTVLV